MYKKVKVVLLPTTIKSDLGLTFIYGETVLKQYSKCDKDRKDMMNRFYNIYITSDDEIKEGDWCIFDRFPKVIAQSKCNMEGKGSAKKIITTTDTSLQLPQPSQQFIEEYIECYNKSEVITDVIVEYETLYNGYRHKNGEYQLILKINPEDNTITIKKAKECWNRDEVIKVLIDCCGEVSCEDGVLLGKSPSELFNWIEENL